MRVEAKPVPVNGMVGSERSTLDGSYPLSRPLFVVTCRTAGDAAARRMRRRRVTPPRQ